jgi:hypothetical protein
MYSNGPEKPQIRIGLLLDSPIVSKYVRDFVAWVQSHERLNIVAVLLIARHQNDSAGSRSCRKNLFKLVVAIERILLRKNRRHCDHFSGFDISNILPNAALYCCDNEQDFQAIEGAHLELLVAFTNVLPQKLYKTTKLGILILTHSSELNESSPAGFWEVYLRADVTGFTVEHLDPARQVKDVLLSGYVATQFYYLLNQATLFEKSHYYLFKTIEKVCDHREMPKGSQRLIKSYTFPEIPSVSQSIGYLLGLAQLIIGKVGGKFRRFSYTWNVGYFRSDWRQTEPSDTHIVRNPPGHILADPFVISRDGRDVCFVEDLDSATNRGIITVYDVTTDPATYIGGALAEDFHLSFPYLFAYRGALYMCPETSQSREIRIYKCREFPLRWQLEKVIMRDLSAVDTLLFEHNSRWWLMTNIDPAQWGDHSLELCIFSAASPLDDAWTPHPGNPFLIDASRTRNGGIVLEGDKIFRVAQGQGFDMYGKRTTINEIVQLDDDVYIERCVREISPIAKNGIVSTHHFHTNGAISTFDFAHKGGGGTLVGPLKFAEIVNVKDLMPPGS